ncbi:hypothetical protein BDV96DRAFT_645251 [Lophiotrema nucula]|uniref:Uncharacterized protein n=1 Tax=Lophiotrema nucula TaxID=690887 RepID=A0A6A5ZET3_9PLEO|nr:hypothetical protein BDV96DRAFT_645251 [Lophiotrema nucula]
MCDSATLPDVTSSADPDSLSGFNSLPDELLLEVLHYLAGSNDVIDHNPKVFHPLSLVNRRLNRVVTPFLYSHIGPDAGALSTFATRPELLQHVREIAWSFNDKAVFRRRTKQQLISHIEQIPLPWPASIISDATDNQLDFLEMGAILCQTANVRAMRLTVWPRSSNFDPGLTDCLPLLFQSDCLSRDQIHGFGNLQSLTIDLNKVSAERIACLFRLQSLKHLDIDKLPGLESSEEIDSWHCPPGTSPIESLRVDTSNENPAVVLKAIQSCRSLQLFEVETTYQNIHRGFFDEVMNALIEHRTSLTHLRLYDDAPQFEGEPLWQLRELTSMVELTMPLRFVLGVGADHNLDGPLPSFCDVLPPSLRFLEVDIMGDAPFLETTSAFDGLLLDGPDHFDRIYVVSVIYDLRDAFDPSLPMDFVKLKRLSTKVGIDFKYTLMYTGLHEEEYAMDRYYMNAEDAVSCAQEALLECSDGETLKYHAEVKSSSKPLFDLPDREEFLHVEDMDSSDEEDIDEEDSDKEDSGEEAEEMKDDIKMHPGIAHVSC